MEFGFSEGLTKALARAFHEVPETIKGQSVPKDAVVQGSLIHEIFGDLSEHHDELKSFLITIAESKENGIISAEELEGLVSRINAEIVRPEADSIHYEVIMRNLGSDEVDMLRDAFIHMDMDSDGFVSLEEMLHVVRTVVGDEKFGSLAEYLQPIFIVADKDRDMKLSLTEFLLSFAEGPGVVPTEVVNACVSSIRVRLTDEEIFALQERFRKIDLNGDGFIDPNELLIGLKEALGGKFPEPNDATFVQIVNVVMALADTDHDGRLSLSEFIRSFQEDQGVLPAAFIDTRTVVGLRDFTPAEEEILKKVLSTFGEDVMLTDDLVSALSQGISNYVADPSDVQELCELVLSMGVVNDGAVQVSELVRSLNKPNGILVNADDRVNKVKEKLLELVSPDELHALSANLASMHKQGFVDLEVATDALFHAIAPALARKSHDFVLHIAQLLASTGEVDANNTRKVSVDDVIAFFANSNANLAAATNEPVVAEDTSSHAPTSAEEPKTLPESSTTDVETPNKKAVVLHSAGGHVQPRPSTASSQYVYQSSPVRSDPSGCPITDSQLKVEFDKYDVDGKGYLDREEFKTIYMGMEHFGVEPTPSEVDELFSRYSRGRAVIEFPEFTVLMLHRSKM